MQPASVTSLMRAVYAVTVCDVNHMSTKSFEKFSFLDLCCGLGGTLYGIVGHPLLQHFKAIIGIEESEDIKLLARKCAFDVYRRHDRLPRKINTLSIPPLSLKYFNPFTHIFYNCLAFSEDSRKRFVAILGFSPRVRYLVTNLSLEELIEAGAPPGWHERKAVNCHLPHLQVRSTFFIFEKEGTYKVSANRPIHEKIKNAISAVRNKTFKWEIAPVE